MKDAEYVAGRVVDEKTKNKPNIFLSKEEPVNLEKEDLWISIEDKV